LVLSEDVDTELSFTVGYNHIFNTIMSVGTEYQLNRGMAVTVEDGAVEITPPKGFKQEPRISGVFCLLSRW